MLRYMGDGVLAACCLLEAEMASFSSSRQSCIMASWYCSQSASVEATHFVQTILDCLRTELPRILGLTCLPEAPEADVGYMSINHSKAPCDVGLSQLPTSRSSCTTKMASAATSMLDTSDCGSTGDPSSSTINTDAGESVNAEPTSSDLQKQLETLVALVEILKVTNNL